MRCTVSLAIFLFLLRVFLPSLSSEALFLSYLSLDALDLVLDQLLEDFCGHSRPAFLKDELEYRVVKQALWLGAHGIEHALVLVLRDQLVQSRWSNEQLEGLAHLAEHVVEDVVVGELLSLSDAELCVRDDV